MSNWKPDPDRWDEWAEQIGISVMHAMRCTHDGADFGDRAVCVTCFENTQQICVLIAAERDAQLAKFEALAEAWADVLAECKAVDPKWILDRSVMALDTARRDLCAVIKEARA